MVILPAEKYGRTRNSENPESYVAFPYRLYDVGKPELENGGTGMITLQLMLMQTDGKRIQLLPAWPKSWTADFKLHAPYRTTVEGHVENGVVSNLKVMPAARAKDITIVRTDEN